METLRRVKKKRNMVILGPFTVITSNVAGCRPGGNKKDPYPRPLRLDKGLADDIHRPRPGSVDRIDGLGAGHVSGRWLLPFQENSREARLESQGKWDQLFLLVFA
jgi:hypothetical protein